MSITPERKSAVIKEYATKKDDTGSPEVQVAIAGPNRPGGEFSPCHTSRELS